jgi:hypothetical protein
MLSERPEVPGPAPLTLAGLHARLAGNLPDGWAFTPLEERDDAEAAPGWLAVHAHVAAAASTAPPAAAPAQDC